MLALYLLALGTAFAFVSFDFRVPEKPGDTILVDLTEPPAPEPPKPVVKPAPEPRMHDVAAPEERTAQVAGKDETTQAPNPRRSPLRTKAGPTNRRMRAIRGRPKGRTRPAVRVRG